MAANACMQNKAQKGEPKVPKKVRDTPVSGETATRILREIPHNNSFYFFNGIGQYSGKFAISLTDFCQKLGKMDVKSIVFHFGRRDFQKWIKGTIGDVYLANRINKIKRPIEGAALRDEIYENVQTRLTELKKLLASEEPYVEHE